MGITSLILIGDRQEFPEHLHDQKARPRTTVFFMLYCGDNDKSFGKHKRESSV